MRDEGLKVLDGWGFMLLSCSQILKLIIKWRNTSQQLQSTTLSSNGNNFFHLSLAIYTYVHLYIYIYFQDSN